MLKSNSEMSLEIQEQIFLFIITTVLMAQRPDFCISYRLGDIREIEWQKKREPTNSPLYISTFNSFSRSIDRIKEKFIETTYSLPLSPLKSKRISFSYQWLGYERSRNTPIWNDFQISYSVLPLRLLLSFALPSRIFICSHYPFFVLSMSYSGGGGRKDMNNQNGG